MTKLERFERAARLVALLVVSILAIVATSCGDTTQMGGGTGDAGADAGGCKAGPWAEDVGPGCPGGFYSPERDHGPAAASCSSPGTLCCAPRTTAAGGSCSPYCQHGGLVWCTAAGRLCCEQPR